MARELVLIVGGARGGKSAFAQTLALRMGERVLYVATAQRGDDEMTRRIEAHRELRPSGWTTLEAPLQVGRAVAGALYDQAVDVVLLDCLTLLVSNAALADLPDGDPELIDEPTARRRVSEEVDGLLSVYEAGGASWIIVTNEVGWGLVPPYPVGRVYRDLLGWANQRLGQTADRVYLMVAGLPIEVKSLAARVSG